MCRNYVVKFGEFGVLPNAPCVIAPLCSECHSFIGIEMGATCVKIRVLKK